MYEFETSLGIHKIRQLSLLSVDPLQYTICFAPRMQGYYTLSSNRVEWKSTPTPNYLIHHYVSHSNIHILSVIKYIRHLFIENK